MKEPTEGLVCAECGCHFCKLITTYPSKYCSRKCKQRATRQRTKPWLRAERKLASKLQRREWLKTEKGKASTKAYRQRPEVKARQAAINDDRSRWESLGLASLGQADRAKTIEVYEERDRLNALHGAGAFHVDHIKPRALGGDHVWWNMQIISAEENHKKNAYFRPEDQVLYAQRIHQLLTES